MPDPPRKLDELFQDFRKSVAKFDSDNSKGNDISLALANKLPLEEWDGDYLLYHRLLSYLRFFQREQHRLEGNTHLLRPIAAAEAKDTLVQQEVTAHLEKQKPDKARMELLNPFDTAPDAARVRTLRFDGDVRSVKWSPDNRLVAADIRPRNASIVPAFLRSRSAAISTVNVETWQQTGKPLKVRIDDPIHKLSGWVGSSSSPDGRFVAACSIDKTVIIRNSATGQVVGGALRGHIDSVSSVAWSPDGRYLASSSRDGTVIIWDMETWSRAEQPYTGHTNQVNSVTWCPDGRFLASGSEDGRVIVWNWSMETLQWIGKPLQEHLSRVYSVSCHPDGTFLASSGQYETVIWNTKIWQRKGERIIGQSYSVTWNRDGHYFANQDMRYFKDVDGLEISDENDYVVRNVIIRDAVLWQRTAELQISGRESLISLSWNPMDSSLIASGSLGGTVSIWNAESGQRDREPLSKHASRVTSVSWSPNGKHIASGSWDKTIIIWDTTSRQQVGGPLQDHTDHVNSVSWSHDSRYLASGSSDSSVIVWDATNMIPVIRFPLESGAISVAFDPSGCQPDGSYRLAIGQSNCWVRIYKFHPARKTFRVRKESL